MSTRIGIVDSVEFRSRNRPPVRVGSGVVERWAPSTVLPAVLVSTAGRLWDQEEHRLLSCWPNADRYPVLTWNGRLYYLHILVLTTFAGPCPAGLEACHGPGGPGDNALTNLRWDTHQENLRDVVRSGHHVMANRTHCPRGHPYAGANLYPAKDGFRRCWICVRESWKRANLRRRSGRAQ